MQQVDQPPNGKKIALLYGLSIGLILAALATAMELINTFVLTNASEIALSFVLLAVVFLLGLAAYFIAGILASRQTAKVGTGCIAGLWTGVFYGIVSLGVSMGLFFAVNLPRLLDVYAKNSTNSSLTLDNYRLGATIGGVAVEIFGLLFAIGLGAGIGALGGLLGKHTSKVAPKPVYPYPYPGQPYPGQPYPGQPYPGQQLQQGGQAPTAGGTDSTDPNQSYSEHPY